MRLWGTSILHCGPVTSHYRAATRGASGGTRTPLGVEDGAVILWNTCSEIPRIVTTGFFPQSRTYLDSLYFH